MICKTSNLLSNMMISFLSPMDENTIIKRKTNIIKKNGMNKILSLKNWYEIIDKNKNIKKIIMPKSDVTNANLLEIKFKTK